ncbi:MAG: dynamin family protein, partial [Chloroflexi bacterium]|nr:dynamin family protein [Chloroflexota bacterium]
MLKSILTTSQEELLKHERQWLADLQVILARLGASSEDQTTLSRSIQQLDELFLLVIVGEFNAGKSAFINALLGQNVLKEGVTPTTSQINVLKFGDTSQRRVQEAHLHLLIEEAAAVDRHRRFALARLPADVLGDGAGIEPRRHARNEHGHHR